MKILLGMLLLFKHKGDKQYVLNNVQKIFIFVEEDVHGNIIRTYVRLFVLYIYQTFKLEEQEVEKILPDLSSTIKKEFMTTYEILVEKGKVEGKIEGEIKGEIKGKLKTKLENFTELLINFPNLTNAFLSKMVKIPVPLTKKLKGVFQGKDQKAFLKVTRQLFSEIPNMRERQWKEMDKFSLDLWKRYQKATKFEKK